MADPYRYHVLLIGCDKYPPNQNSLHGCVNDIDAIERILLDAPGVGIPSDQIRLTRLAAPHDDTITTSRYLNQTKLPTRENIIAALQSLAGADVRPSDRVLIYYSGHGGQTKRVSSPGWHECLVASDNQLLFDQELNPLIAAIAQRTSDLTIVLDCCHSAGATRAYITDPPHGAARVAVITNPLNPQPDPALLGNASTARGAGEHLLQATRPNYIAIVACQSDEKAQEDAFEGAGTHGFLTYALIQTIGRLNLKQRSRICWAHIWPRLIDEVNRAAAASGRVPQHPWLIGQPARQVFGGSWTPCDPGFPIRRNPDDTFSIEAGVLVGFGVDATVGIYEPTPAFFPEIGSDQDRHAQIGTARVIRAERATCVATTINPPPIPLPDGARVRMISPAKQERLRVRLDRADPDPAPVVGQSDLLELVDHGPSAEIWVDRTADGWMLSNDLNKGLATLRLSIPQDESMRAEAIRDAHQTLRFGLVTYAAYNTALRLAKRCSDLELDQVLRVTLLDCSDAGLLAQIEPKNPALPELPRNADQINQVSADHRFCIRITNTYFKPLYVTVLNCTAGGKVEYLGTIGINYEDVETIWYNNVHRSPFYAVPDNPAVDTIDRIIAIATTRPGADLRNLKTEATIQQIFDKRVRGTGGGAPPTTEFWTATTCLLKMLHQG